MENEDLIFAPTESGAKGTPVAPVTVPEVQPTIQNVPTENPEFKEKKKKSKAKFWLIFGIIASAVVTAAAITIIATWLFGSKYIEQETEIVTFTTNYGEVFAIKDGKKIDEKVLGKRSSFVSNINGDVALLAVTQNAEDKNAPKELYYIQDNNMTKLVNDAKGCRLSADGNAALYMSGASALSKIDFKRDKTTYIADQVGDYEISPNGEVAAYTIPGYGCTSVYIFDGKESSLVGDTFPANSTILGLSDKGNYIYIKGNSDNEAGPLYCYTRKDNEYVKLCDNFLYLICFNYNNTQILYTQPGGSTYFVEKDNNVKQISTMTVTPHISSRVGACDRTYGIKNLCDGFYSSLEADDMRKLYYVDKKGNLSELTENAVTSVTISHDGDTAYFLTSEKNLYKIKADAYAKGTMLAQNVDAFTVSTDSDRLYFTIGGTLYFGFNKLLAKEVMDSVSEFTVIDNGICIFSSSDGVFKCHKGRKISRLEYDKIDFFSYDNAVFYCKKINSNMYELYCSDGEEYFEYIGSAEYFY